MCLVQKMLTFPSGLTLKVRAAVIFFLCKHALFIVFFASLHLPVFLIYFDWIILDPLQVIELVIKIISDPQAIIK